MSAVTNLCEHGEHTPCYHGTLPDHFLVMEVQRLWNHTSTRPMLRDANSNSNGSAFDDDLPKIPDRGDPKPQAIITRPLGRIEDMITIGSQVACMRTTSHLSPGADSLDTAHPVLAAVEIQELLSMNSSDRAYLRLCTMHAQLTVFQYLERPRSLSPTRSTNASSRTADRTLTLPLMNANRRATPSAA